MVVNKRIWEVFLRFSGAGSGSLGLLRSFLVTAGFTSTESVEETTYTVVQSVYYLDKVIFL